MNPEKMKAMWNSRYAAEEFAYGTEPNRFFQDVLERMPLSGDILLAAEGEGRNAVYAAQQGLSAFAFDISESGKTKADRLATDQGVEIDYRVGPIEKLDFEGRAFDAAVLIFAHVPPPVRPGFHRAIGSRIKPGGLVILEGFSQNNLKFREENPGIGGPNIPEMLFTEAMIQADFPDFEVIELAETEVELQEGRLHNGTGMVIRFVGRKMAPT